ncbi:MAG: acylphosphatase [Nitrososphaeria archaeon]
MDGKLRVRVVVSGLVQGVFFRASMRRKAQELGVHGWVRNLRDGRVQALLEGDESSVRRLMKWCEIGPPGAEVRKVEVVYEEYVGEYEDFKIIY